MLINSLQSAIREEWPEFEQARPNIQATTTFAFNFISSALTLSKEHSLRPSLRAYSSASKLVAMPRAVAKPDIQTPL